MLLDYEHKSKPVQRNVIEADAVPPDKKTVLGESSSTASFIGWSAWLFVGVSLVLAAAIWFATGRRASPQIVSSVQLPVTFIDEVEHLPASARKAIPISLPFAGTVTFDIQVIRGNPIDVFLTTANQLDNLKGADWYNLKKIENISAVHSRAFASAAHIAPGGYYLVVSDLTVGVPSSAPSEISVKVRLSP